ncbi:UNVERIFIED_CONTAM: hypothetical protein GTU68_050342 [Idotea baltica]|nr:hypothetical protein [Idotea baltica]
MGNRISKVVTRNGDNGTTGEYPRYRLIKMNLCVQAIGEVDELNSEIGVVVAFSDDDGINQQLLGIQHDLFNLGGMLSYPDFDGFSSERVDALEALVDDYNDSLPPLKEFILPGGTQAAAHAQKARAVCRRTERVVVTLSASDTQLSGAGKYLNRLSDLLFTLGRLFNQRAGCDEVLWSSHRTKG